jgi:hypothetical protein
MSTPYIDPDLILASTENPNPRRLSDKLSAKQLAAMAGLLSNLHDRFLIEEGHGTLSPTSWAEWGAFIHGAYGLGFVCHDAGDVMDDGSRIRDFIAQLAADPALASNLSLRQLRQIIHYIVRSERWGDAGGAIGAGTLYRFVVAGLAKAFEKRLTDIATLASVQHSSAERK